MPPALANEIAELIGHDLRKVFNSLHFWLAGVAETSQQEHKSSDRQWISQSLSSQFLHYLPTSNTGTGKWDVALQTIPIQVSACQACGPTEELSLASNSKNPSTGSAYQELDSCALLSDSMSLLDIVAPGPSQDCCHAPWWKCSLQDSLLDAVAESEPVSAGEKLGDSYRDCLLSILSLPSVYSLPSVTLTASHRQSHYYRQK